MERKDAFDYYVDYLLASTKNATATGLSAMLDHQLSHDYISDCLNQEGLSQKKFWTQVKPFVREIETSESCLCIDDVIVEKPHSTVNEIINYHYDHTKGRSVKGMNIVNFLLHSTQEDTPLQCPLGYHIVHKTIPFEDKKTGKIKYKSELSKNEVVLQELHRFTFLNQVKFKYILFDIWFGASSTLKYIAQKLKKIFVCPLKTNRLVALSLADKKEGKFIPVSEVKFENLESLEVYVKGLDFPVLLVKQIFTNKDHSKAVQYLISNDTKMNHQQITTIYQKRWKVEEFHKSLKQNTLLAKSPTKKEVSQANHVFASMIAFVQLEKLKIKEKLNHFALKAKLYLKMLKAAYQEVLILKQP